MNRIVVLGEPSRVDGFRLVGATVVPAREAEGFRRAWTVLPADTRLLIITPAAEAAIGDRLSERPGLTWVVMPA